ncbi:MAG: hypothetical protein K0M70_08280 [Arenimonas sp.]|uniref:hypothetical protein n=1 Tax=Arenimonas sp. TaxID=1872635 RepID=UPI0025C55988|nr:hypothetical protein [Arenimonas sp.]MBW8367839.1 hypothetical protein [Arenimonas sp.]
MAMKKPTALALAFAGALLAVGVGYWAIPYSQLALPDDIVGWGLLAVAALAAVARVVSASGFWATTLAVGAAVPAAVLARVVMDTWSDPTSHNLWPFEIVLAAGPGFLASAVGALAGGVLASRRRA